MAAAPRLPRPATSFPDEFLVQAREGAPASEILALAAAQDSAPVRPMLVPGLYYFKTRHGQDAGPARSALAARKDLVRRVEPNLLRYAHDYTPKAYPNDPYYQTLTTSDKDLFPGNGFILALTQWDLAWNTGTGGMSAWSKGSGGVTLSDLDTGMNVHHEDFLGKVVGAYNAFNGGTSVTDSDGHGTDVSSFLSVGTNNGKGIAGGAVNAGLLPVQISTDGNFGLSQEVDGLHWAADHGATVLNLSFGGAGTSSLEQDAITYALSKGCMIFASAGNEAASGNPVEYPANNTGVIPIGASDHTDHWESFSNWGSYLFCVAPDGGPGCSFSGNHAYDYDNEGTSFASPAVAALAAVLIANGSTGPDCVSRIARTCDKIDAVTYPYGTANPLGSWSTHYGYGRINAYRAMTTLVPPVLTGINGGLSSIDLTWTAPPLDDSPSEPLSYLALYRANASGGPYSAIGSYALTATGASDATPLPGQQRYYVLRGVNSNGLATKASNELSAAVFATPTPTFTASATPTVTPTFAGSGFDRAIFAPVPAKRGQDLELFFDRLPAKVAGALFNASGERVLELKWDGNLAPLWRTGSLAAGIYYAVLDVDYVDGSHKSLRQKILLIP